MIVVQDQCTGVSSQEERACVQTLVGIGGSRLGYRPLRAFHRQSFTAAGGHSLLAMV
jgi:hypothetical protein